MLVALFVNVVWFRVVLPRQHISCLASVCMVAVAPGSATSMMVGSHTPGPAQGGNLLRPVDCAAGHCRGCYSCHMMPRQG
jgi:hypothetical protein